MLFGVETDVRDEQRCPAGCHEIIASGAAEELLHWHCVRQLCRPLQPRSHVKLWHRLNHTFLSSELDGLRQVSLLRLVSERASRAQAAREYIQT